MIRLLDVGRVARAHGLKGSVVVELWSNRPERVAPGSVLTGAGRELRVAGSSPMAQVGGRDRWLVSFEGVADRAMAEALRGEVLKAAPLSDDAALWVHELVGAEVVDQTGTAVGVVESVEANPASDLLVLAGGALIPLVFVVDSAPGRLTVELPPGLLDL